MLLILTIIWIGWSVYHSAIHEDSPGENFYYAANKYFEDGFYVKALEAYKNSFKENPYSLHAKRGIARSLMQLEQFSEALNIFNDVIKQDPNFGASYANRGILHDRMQAYDSAITDYKKAIQLDPDLAKGPSWLTRFFRNQTVKPPTILDRLNYLQSELQKPENERTLQLPEKDNKQRPYKL